MEQWNYITCLVILCFNCNSKLHLIKSNNILIHTKEISASFYVEDKWLQTRRSDTLIFHQEKSWVACTLKTLLHLKIAQVISRQWSQRYIESLTRKAVGEIWRAEPTIRFHRSCLQRQDSTFPEHYNSALTELQRSTATPSLLSDCQLHSKQITLLHNQVFSSSALLGWHFHQMILDSLPRLLRSKGLKLSGPFMLQFPQHQDTTTFHCLCPESHLQHVPIRHNVFCAVLRWGSKN